MRIFTVFMIALCCCLKVTANPGVFHQYGLQHLTQENGLANNTLLEIHQDKKGFLWLGTDVGISRYDGIHFHNYDLTDIEPRAISRICEMEQDSLLWLKQDRRKEIACFDKKTGLYIPLQASDKNLLNNIVDLCIADSTLYAITSTGINRLDYQRTEKGITLMPTVVMEHHCNLLSLECGNNHLYALDEVNNVVIYHLDTKVKKVLNYSRLNTKKAVLNLRALGGHLWISTNWNGTYCYNPNTDELRMLGESNSQLINQCVNDLSQKSDSVFIAATPHSILRIAFKGTDYIHAPFELSEISFDNYMYDSFIKNRVTKLYVDRKNSVVWLGTFGKGLVKSNLQDNNIHRISLNPEIKDVNGVVQDARGCIWLTTTHNGIWRSQTNKVSPDMKFEMWERSIPNSYYCIYKDDNGSLWVGDETGTVQWMNPLSNQIVSFQPKYNGENSVGGILKLYLCVHNQLWLVTQKGLFIYNYLENKCVAGMPYDDTISEITSLYEDGDGTMWLGTNDGVRKAEVDGKSILLTNGREEKAGISKSKVLAIYVNRHNQLYVSYADKIVQTDGRREGITDIKILQKDMMSGHTQCIIDDKSGNTWMGNNVGLMTINNKTKASYTYTFPERFYDVCQLNDGQLLWSCSTGLIYFDPVELKKRSLPEQLYISDLGVNYNKVEIGEEISGQVILKKPLYQMKELVLNHNNNSVVFYLTNFSYKQIPSKMEYRLMPVQKEWKSSYMSEIEFSNLQPGSYTLEVRPTSINEEEVPLTTLDIKVKEHWASTYWAMVIYLLLAILFSALIYYYMKSKAERRLLYLKKEEGLKNSLANEIKHRKEEETIFRLRNQARYGMARELLTPLSLITAPLKEIVSDPTLTPALQPKAKVAYRNAISMQDVCNLMQNIYEQESEELKLNVAEYPVTEIVYNAISSSNELLNITPIKLHYDKNKRIKQEIWVDRKKMEYIFRNILSNAYRHISYAGNVYVNNYLENIDGKDYFCFQVKDEGKDIIEKSAVYMLSKEEGGDELTSQLHPELGLVLMKEHITAHHGDIRIEQDKETGTCVTVYVPLGKEHLENDARVMFVEPEEKKVEKEKTPDIMTAEEKEQQIIDDEDITFTMPAPGAKHKILVIEDHKDIRLYLKVLFSSNYTLIMAENGEEGVRLARKEMPDIILSDVMMPVMNGFECTRILKEDVKTCHIPIILLTALVGDTDVVKGIELGADDYILKPFNPEILRSKVKRLIKNRMDLKQAYMKLMMATNNEEENEGQKEDPFIRQIFDIVENNLQNPDFNVKRLAEMLNMSQPTLYRRVKMLTNYTIIELIRGVRLKRAAELLRTRKYSIQEVSEMVGYNDAPTFRKHFVDFYGSTPSTFANKEEVEEKKITV